MNDPGLNRFDNATWDRFFEFLYPADGEIPDSAIDDELKAAGIDVTAAQQKVRKAIQLVRPKGAAPCPP